MAKSDPLEKKDFFISYNKADRAWAEWIAQQLEQVGKYGVVIQAWDFRPGGNFVLDMHRALETCDRTLAVLSPDYLTSVFTAPEWAAAFGADSAGFKQKLVPVRVRDCKLDGLLSNIVYVDLLNLNAEKASKALLAGVDRGPVDRKAPRSFPGMADAGAHAQPRPPGMLPDIWNVPHLRNPNFTEPGQRLTDMREALRSGRPAALAGLGGVGKTQLAVEYAYRHAGDYAIVWWLRSEQPATLAADYAALAAPLDLPEKDAKEQAVIIVAVRDALRQRPDWLLVFDNANTPKENRDYLPGAGGHVLITSRNAAWGGVAHAVPVKKWPPEVAAEFLLKRTGQADASAAGELARELDYLPLALEQAAAYIESAGKTLAAYLAIFRKHQIEVFRHGEPGTDYPDTVATTWEISFRALEKETPAGAGLLHLCAFFAPDNIPTGMITAGAEHLPEPLRAAVSDALTFDDAVSAIRRYSLLDTDSEANLSLHRLVQAVIRDRLDEPGRQQWAEAAVNAVNKAFPNNSDDVRTWKECKRLLPHAIATTDLAEPLGIGLEAVARLLNQTGLYAFGRAEYSNARAAYERALKIDEKALGPDHPNVATDVNNLGSVLQALGDFPGAKAACERALKIDEKAFGPDHPDVAIRVNNLGGVLQALGDFPGAKAAYERALKIFEKAFGPDHPNVATGVWWLGTLLLASGDLPGAKAACERALQIFQKSLGDDHPTTRHVRGDIDSLSP
jgi:tetratricopeptide (TPR) repeat protein